ncbi:MAG: DUF58 domain-containing protein [Planctomycetota bacterium]|nr:MAG: DUF58 domain-containing protein [Planctomycetota bacterium]
MKVSAPSATALAPRAISQPPATALRQRPTAFGWLSLIAIPVLASSLWWQSGGAAIYIACALAAAWLCSWWLAPRAMTGISGRWLIPHGVVAHEITSLGVQLRSPQAQGPCELEVALEQGSLHLARIPGLGPAPLRLWWPTRLTRRGLSPLPPLIIAHSRPFGMMRVSLPVITSSEVLVLPALGNIRPEALEVILGWLESGFHAISPGTDEVAHLRPYRYGDTMRSVHWRASARCRSIQVTERHAPQARKLTVFLDHRGPQRHSSRFERLVCATATTLVHFLETGWEVQLQGAWLGNGMAQGSRETLLEYLAMVECGDANAALEGLPRHEACLIFTLEEGLQVPADVQALVISLSKAEELVRMGRHIR